MQLSNLLFVLALPVIALACEGACITDVTSVWVGNYTQVVTHVLQASNLQLSNRLGQTSTFKGNDVGHLRPFLDAFKKDASAILQQAIFPGFFHGKCQREGVEPAGCPNPDCPVVCGTPGSMVHFYSKLRQIAYHAVLDLLQTYTDKNSEPYKKVQKNLASHARPRSLRFARATFYPGEAESVSASGFLKRTDPQDVWKNSVGGIIPLMKIACNGMEKDDEKLEHCSWEEAMKGYILTFP